MGVGSEWWVVEKDTGFQVREDSDDVVEENVVYEQKSSAGWFNVNLYQRWKWC
ncbi:hypothetical protein LguiA_013937 [Lonicera macranthoides]